MAGDPSCIAERLLKLELREPHFKESSEITAEAGPPTDAAEAAAIAATNPANSNTEAREDAASKEAVQEKNDVAEENDDNNEEEDVEEESDEEECTEPDDMDELIDQITSDNRRCRFFGAQSLRRRISDRYEAPAYSRMLISPALVALVVNLDNDSDPELQFESVWALTNLLAGSGARPTDLVVSSDLARPLIRLLGSAPTDRMREQACWALANVAGESPSWRDQLLLGGDLPGALISLWESDPNNGLLDASSLLLVNLLRDREPRIRFELAQRLISAAVSLLRHPYESVVPHVVWALSYAVEDCETRARLLLQIPDALECLIEFLESLDDALLVPTLRLFCGLSACLDPLPASLVRAPRIFTAMRRLLDHTDTKMRRQALLFFGNVSGGPEAQLEAAAQAGCLAGVGRILLMTSGSGLGGGGGSVGEAGSDSGTDGAASAPAISYSSDLERREAFWIVPNFMLSRGHKFSQRIIDECLEGFLETLSLQDAEICRCILLCVRHLLFAARYKNRDDLDFDSLKRKIEACGGLQKIEQAQKTDDKELIKLSFQIVDQFFLGNEKKYMEEEEASHEASPSTVDSEIGDEHRADCEATIEGQVEKETLGSLIGGLQATEFIDTQPH